MVFMNHQFCWSKGPARWKGRCPLLFRPIRVIRGSSIWPLPVYQVLSSPFLACSKRVRIQDPKPWSDGWRFIQFHYPYDVPESGLEARQQPQCHGEFATHSPL